MPRTYFDTALYDDITKGEVPAGDLDALRPMRPTRTFAGAALAGLPFAALSTSASGVHSRRVLSGGRRGGRPHLVLRDDLAHCRAESGVTEPSGMRSIECRRGLKAPRRQQGRRLENRSGNAYDLLALIALGAPRHDAILTPVHH